MSTQYLPQTFESAEVEHEFLVERDQAIARARRARRQHRRLARRPETREAIALFLVVFAAYTALGWYTTVHLLAAPFDAVSRLAHADFVLHADPGKLTAIGFVWPPVITLVLIPFAVVDGLANSLWALPLMSSMFAAGMFAVINRTYRLLGMGFLARYALLVAFAFNPFLARYASNGMGEIVSLFFVAVAMHYLIKWIVDGHDWHLAPSGMAWALAMLSRYEIGLYALAAGIAVALILWRRRASGARAEGTLLLYVAPVVYCLLLWVLFNFLITGNPLYFVDEQVRQRFTEYRKSTFTDNAEPFRLIVEMNLKLFLPTLLLLPAMLVVALLRRGLTTLMMAGLLAINPAVTLVAMLRAGDLALAQPRFNIRSLPMAMIAIGWLFYVLKGRTERTVLVVLSVLVILAGHPLTWSFMKEFPYQDQRQEARFVEAIESGRSQSTPDLDIPAARRMADYVAANVEGRHSILVDDAQSFAPMLVGSDVPRYYDRIYKGDAIWERVAAAPRRRVGWMLVSGAREDLLGARFTGREPYLTRRFAAGKYVLYSVAPPDPRNTPTG